MKKILFAIVLTMSVSCMSQTTQDASNGYYYPPKGIIRFLLAFADVNNDPCSEVIHGWNAGELPRYKDSLIDVVSSSNMQYGISRYYQQASFGSLTII